MFNQPEGICRTLKRSFVFSSEQHPNNLLLCTVSGRQDEVVCDESPATKPHVVNEQRHDPRPLVLLGLKPAYDPLPPRVVAVILNAANVWWRTEAEILFVTKSILTVKVPRRSLIRPCLVLVGEGGVSARSTSVLLNPRSVPAVRG